MENTNAISTKTIIPRDIIIGLCPTHSGMSYSNFIDNKPKMILQSYGLYDNFVGSIIEEWPILYIGAEPKSINFSHGELFDNHNSPFTNCYGQFAGHILPAIDMNTTDFARLIEASDQFEIFSNEYGIPSIMFGTYSNGKPIIMPILNWNNLPKNINPFQENDGIFELGVKIGLPPQMYHDIIKDGNNSCYFSPNTAINEKADIRQLLKNLFDNSEFFDKPIEYTPRRHPLTDSERLIKAAKVNSNYKAYKMREKQDEKYMKLIEELSNTDKSLADQIKQHNFRLSLHLKELAAQREAEHSRAMKRVKEELSNEFYEAHFGLRSGGNGPLDLSEEAAIIHTNPNKHFR